MVQADCRSPEQPGNLQETVNVFQKTKKISGFPMTFVRDLACLGASPGKFQDREWDALTSPSWIKYYPHSYCSEEPHQVCCLPSLLTHPPLLKITWLFTGISSTKMPWSRRLLGITFFRCPFHWSIITLSSHNASG